ncbi:MAG: TetR/AcrR family transcriptional regulator [Steroidobacteraceae bacterium]
MGRRNLHSRDELRELALAEAARLVDGGGMAALGMREVARRMGYTVGSLYMVFTNLDDLIVQVNERTVMELRASLEAVAGRASSAPQRLQLLCAAYLGFSLLHTQRWLMVFEHRLPEGQAAPSTYRGHTRAIFALVAAALRDARRGARDAPDEVAVVLWSAVHGICMLAVTGKLDVGGTRASVQRLLDLLVERFIEVTPGRRHR